MSKRARPLTKRTPLMLARKLLTIRETLGLTQRDFIKQFGLRVTQPYISSWEKGTRIPDLLSLVKYADAANISLDVLIRDEYRLPESLPCKEKYYPR
jgi:transcriptional regulator with XRE-family HTH domain